MDQILTRRSSDPVITNRPDRSNVAVKSRHFSIEKKKEKRFKNGAIQGYLILIEVKKLDLSKKQLQHLNNVTTSRNFAGPV
jgi:hypothetical protein